MNIDKYIITEKKFNQLTKYNNNVTKNMKGLADLVAKSDTYPDLKRSFMKQYNVVFDEWTKLFDILQDINQTLE